MTEFERTCGLTIREAVGIYLNFLKCAGRAVSTAKAYGKSLERLASCLPENCPLAELTDRQLVEALAGWVGDNSTHRETTLNRHRSAVRMFLRWAFETGRTAVNAGLGLRLASADSAPTSPARPDEVRAFLEAVRHSSDGLRVRDEAPST